MHTSAKLSLKRLKNVKDDFVMTVAFKCACEFSYKHNSISFLMALDYFPGRQIAMESVFDYKNACCRGGDEETLTILVKHRTNIKVIRLKSFMLSIWLIKSFNSLTTPLISVISEPMDNSWHQVICIESKISYENLQTNFYASQEICL